ncbi:hypothetical protein NIES2130_31325 [Scytonema sp. HK-05]|nr:hypothetical protein NIES2130_31325 [Scytonema sp. HK-05]
MLDIRRSKAKTRFENRFKNSKKAVTGNKLHEKNIVFQKIKRHNELMMSVLEADDIILVCRNTLRYLLVGMIMLCLLASL